MKCNTIWGVALLAALAVPALAQETVNFDLRSGEDGTVVAPGATVTWEIWVEVTTTENEGLALFSVDLVQDASNPATFDILPADGVPTGLEGFSRPGGVSNPGEGGATSGYIGVQRGDENAKNLIQIGGGQNTFGAPGTNGVGEDADVDAGVGLGSEVMIAQGSFAAPSQPGAYTLRLQSGVANVLTAVNEPPDFSPVAQANVTYNAETVSFTVSTPDLGDMDCDGDVDFDDIAPFVLAIGGQAGYEAEWPDCEWLNGDVDGNGTVDFDDISPFVALLSGK